MESGIIDVRRMGAVGDGLADDGPALAAAFAAAGPEGCRVPPGRYRVARDLISRHPVRIEGRILQPSDKRLVLGARLDLGDYLAAFGPGDLALHKALAALFAAEGDADLDLGGRTCLLDAPIRLDAAGARGAKSIRGGRIAISDVSRGPASDAGAGHVEPGDVPAGAPWCPDLSNVGPGRPALSAPLDPGEAPDLRRPAFALSVTGLSSGATLALEGIDLDLRGRAGGLSVHCDGGAVELDGCRVSAAEGAAIRIIGHSAAGLVMERCTLRGSALGVETGSLGAAISACRFEGLSPALRLGGRGNRISACRIAGGVSGLRPGLVLLQRDAASQVTECDFEGAAIRWGEEAAPPFAVRRDDFAGLSVTGCRFTGRDLPRHARWLEVAPAGPGRSLRDLCVSGNLFACAGGGVERVEEARVALVAGRMRGIAFGSNVHRGVEKPAETPATLQFRLGIPQRSWTLDLDGRLPFAVPTGHVVSVRAAAPLTDGEGNGIHAIPEVDAPRGGALRLVFPTAVAGTVTLILRSDRPC